MADDVAEQMLLAWDKKEKGRPAAGGFWSPVF